MRADNDSREGRVDETEAVALGRLSVRTRLKWKRGVPLREESYLERQARMVLAFPSGFLSGEV